MMETDGANLYFTTTTGRKTVAFSGGSFGPITLPASTTTTAPLTFTASGTLVTTPLSGQFEFDGTYFYGTASLGRRPISLKHYGDAITSALVDTTALYTYTNTNPFDVEVLMVASTASATWVNFSTCTLTRGANTVVLPVGDNRSGAGNYANARVWLSPGDALNIQGISNSGGTPNVQISVVPR